MKSCSRCKVKKPLTDFSPDRRSRDGHRERCRLCHAAACRESYSRGPRAHPFVDELRCSHCRTVKPLDQFYTDHRRRNGRQSHCKECQKAATKRVARADPAYHLLKSAKYRAQRAQIAFDLTRDDVIVPAVCPVFGTPFEFGEGKWAPRSPTLDRIDPTKGYIPGNVAVISWRANNIKHDATLAELEQLCEWLRRQSDG